MPREVELTTETGDPHRARLRPGTAMDRRTLVMTWEPILRRGPAHWTDREWPWRAFGVSELHLDLSPEWMVLEDEEPAASGELFGVLVTTGPTTTREAGIEKLLPLDGGLLWLEYIAIAPSVRPDCPARHRRQPRLKGIGPVLMREAITRSKRLGLEGRICLHAEGSVARTTYQEKWGMRSLGEAAHRAGGDYPVYFGDAGWAARF
jgi:hypothetical protein